MCKALHTCFSSELVDYSFGGIPLGKTPGEKDLDVIFETYLWSSFQTNAATAEANKTLSVISRSFHIKSH